MVFNKSIKAYCISIILFSAAPIGSAYAVPISISGTVLGASGPYSTDFSLNYIDSNNDLSLSLLELTNISWVQTNLNTNAMTSEVSLPFNISPDPTGPIFTVLNNQVTSTTAGSFVFSTTRGGIGLQTFGSAADILGLFNSCIVSCGPRPAISDLVVTGASTSVPEPSILALMGLGLAGIGFTRRRRAS